MNDVSFTGFILELDEHLPLFWRLLKLSRPRRSLIEAFQRSGLLQAWENLGSAGREAVWMRLWQRTFSHMPPCLPSRREPDEVFVLFVRNRFLGSILVLEELRVRGRDDVFEAINAVQGTWGRDPVLRQLLAITERKKRKKSL